MTFSLDLLARVRHGLDRFGYCFLSSDELNRLFAGLPENRHTRERALVAFADLCGAEVETTPHLKSARFVPAAPAASPSCASECDLQPSAA